MIISAVDSEAAGPIVEPAQVHVANYNPRHCSAAPSSRDAHERPAKMPRGGTYGLVTRSDAKAAAWPRARLGEPEPRASGVTGSRRRPALGGRVSEAR